jgi:CheY-like chemotaxis protein
MTKKIYIQYHLDTCRHDKRAYRKGALALSSNSNVEVVAMRKLRVNIFDDDISNLKMLKSFLSRRDYEIMTFDKPVVCPVNGSGSKKCNTIHPCADIIITDYEMRGMTGLEMLHRQAQSGCRVDVRNKIVMSSDLDDKGQEMLQKVGCRFFSKPLNFNELLACLDDCEKRVDLSKPLGIRRKEERYPANIDIVYAYNSSEKTYKATVINYSNSGLCLKVDMPLAERQTIVIKTELPVDCANASIRWVEKVEADFYMAGCSCG